MKLFGMAFEDCGEITVVPLVVDDLDDDGAGDSVGLHEGEEGLDGGVFGGRVSAGSEGKCGIVFEDVDVRVDEDWLRRRLRDGEQASRCKGESYGLCSGCGEKAASIHDRDFMPEGAWSRNLKAAFVRIGSGTGDVERHCGLR